LLLTRIALPLVIAAVAPACRMWTNPGHNDLAAFAVRGIAGSLIYAGVSTSLRHWLRRHRSDVSVAAEVVLFVVAAVCLGLDAALSGPTIHWDQYFRDAPAV
jgi:predicted transporter